MQIENQKTLLLVEDESVIAMAAIKKLQKLGYTVIHAMSGDEALSIVLNKKNKVDLVLMDIDLGEAMDGTETALRILSHIDLPIVFLSSHTEPEYVKKVEKITSYGYIVKNCGITVLDASIKMAFRLFNANKELKEKGKLLHSIAENYPNSYIAIIERDLTPSFISGQGFKNIEIKTEEYIGKNLDTVFLNHYNFVKSNFLKTFNGNESSFEICINDFYLHFKTVPLVNDFREIDKILLVVEDITERKKAQDKMLEKSATLESILESTTSPIFSLDKNYNYTSFNKSHKNVMKSIYGVDIEIGKNLLQYQTHEDDRKLSVLNLERTLKGEQFSVSAYSGEEELNRNYFEISHNPIKDYQDNVIGISVFANDITKRKQAEIELIRSENRFRSITENAKDSIFIKNEERQYTFVNNTMQETLNLPELEILGKTPVEIFGKEQGEIINIIDDRTFAGEPVKQTRRLIIGDTEHYYNTSQTPLTFEGDRVTSIMGIVRDITDIMITEQEIKKERMLSEEYINSLPGLFYVFDENTFIRWNKEWPKISGYSEEELSTMYGPDFFEGEDKKVITDKMKEVFQKGATSSMANFITKSGNKIPYFFTGNLIVINNKPLLVGLGIDISEQKKAEQQIQKLLEEKEILLKEVHHRIKNNITVLKGIISAQIDDITSPEAASILNNTILRMESMDVLYDKLYRTKNYNDVSLKDYFEDLIDEVVLAFSDKMKISIKVFIDDVFISSRVVFPLGIIINELITNSMKYAFVDKDTGEITISIKINGKDLYFSYHDTGSGFDENKITKGFGFTLVEMLTKQLKGKSKQQINEEYCLDIHVPLE